MEEETDDPWRWRQTPENQVPVSVRLDAVLMETDALAVFLCGARVFRNGLEFMVTAVSRDFDRGLHSILHGGERPAEQLLLGVEFADGGRATTSDGFSPDPKALRPMLMRGGGSGGSRRSEATFFLSPLPPPGPLRFVTAWPFRGIADHVVEVDTTEILEAATRVRELWPWTPEVYPEAQEPDLPDLPADSWFRTVPGAR